MRAVALVFVLLGIWHGYGLSHRGILEHDEGHNLLAARTYRDVIVWVAHGGPWRTSQVELAELKDALHRQGGTLYPAGKPGYVIGLAVASLATGVSQNSALWLSWLAGMLLVALSSYIAFVLYGRSHAAASIAMVGVGLSPLIGYLSREVGGTIWSMTFGAAGFALLLSANASAAVETGEVTLAPVRKARSVLAGLAFGYGFTCHYNLLPAIGAAFVADLVFCAAILDELHETPGASRLATALRARWKSYALAVAGIILLITGFELVTLAAAQKLHAIYPKYQDYLGELVRIVGTYQLPALRGEAVGEGMRGWGIPALFYMDQVFMREGLLILGVLCVIVVPKRFVPGGPALWAPLTFFALLASFWLLHPWKVERSWGMLVIAMWLVAANLTRTNKNMSASSTEFWSKRKAIALLLLIGIHVFLVSRSWTKLWSARSPMPEVVDETLAYVNDHGGLIGADCASTSFAPLWKWTIIERGRNPQLAAALQHVDFSSFGKSEIVFTDPNTWHDPEFASRRKQIESSRNIASYGSHNPSWMLSSVDLRTTEPLNSRL